MSSRVDEITLITPPSIFLLDERVFMNLGILKVAAALEARGVRVAHIDLSGVENFTDIIGAYWKNMPSKMCGITCTTPQLPLVVKIIRAIRKERPDVRIILGGPHVTLTHSAVKAEKKAGRISRAHRALARLESLADVLVSGDGELAVFEALGPQPGKIIDADDMNSGMFLSNEAYEAMPFPARHLVDVGSYHYEIEGHRSVSLIAQLGCPFGCGFCGGRSSKSLRVIRTRSGDSVIREIRMLYERYGFTGFMLYDDELNVNKGLVPLMDGIARLQESLGVEFRLRGFVKSELFTELQAQAMYRAGFRWILSGFESGAPKLLKNMNKRATLDDNTRTCELAKKCGLKVKALMSIGHPAESLETTELTRDWLLKVQPDDFDCTVITTYPGTPYYDEALPHSQLADVWTYTFKPTGDRLHAYDVDFSQVMDHYKGQQTGYRSYVFTDFLSAEQIVERRHWIESSVREKLGIPYPQARPGIRYERSMGQGANDLPDSIFRQSVDSSTKLKKAG